MARDNFSAPTKRLLASRAGYQCSFPGCNKLTIGPSRKIFSKFNITGTAAHITAASIGGPRYDSNISKEERKSAENGIWLCDYHANLIDKDEQSYSPDTIKQWKKEHETRIRYKQEGINPDIGYITEIKIDNFSKIKNTSNFELKKNNIIFGDNGLGKSLICELVSSFSYSNYYEKWISVNNKGASLFIIKFLKSIESEIKLVVHDKNNINHFYNNLSVHKIIPPYESVLVSGFIDLSKLKDGLDEEDIQFEMKYNNRLVGIIATYFNLPIAQLKTLIEYTRNNERFFISDIKFEDDQIQILLKGRNFYLSYPQLSSSEKEMFIIELSINIAKTISLSRPTILILDFSSFNTMDKYNQIKLFNIFMNSSFDFQTILNYPSLNPLYFWKDYNLIELKDSKSGVTVRNI